MDRACGENGIRSPEKESRCIPRGRQEEKGKMGGLREETSGTQE